MRKLNEPEVREQYQIEITNRFAALENVNNEEDVNRTWEHIKENIQTSAEESLGLHELNQNKPWFDEECLGFLDQRKRAKLQWIQDPRQSNVDILNNVRREVSRHFRNKKKAYLRDKIEELETNSKRSATDLKVIKYLPDHLPAYSSSPIDRPIHSFIHPPFRQLICFVSTRTNICLCRSLYRRTPPLVCSTTGVLISP